jgi:hypothetical protein
MRDHASSAVKRTVAGTLAVGAFALAGWLVYVLGSDAYYDYYLFPRLKDAYITPTRWQDITFLILASIVIAAGLLAGYRLMKYAFGVTGSTRFAGRWHGETR